MKIFGLILVLCLSVFAGLLYWQNNEFDSQKAPESYRVLDDLENKGIYQGEDTELTTLEGKTLKLSSLKGKIVILSFWATWCEPCVDELSLIHI